MSCEGRTRTFLEALASTLYKDSEGNVHINAELLRTDCTDLELALGCDSGLISPEIQLESAFGEDSCNNPVLKIGLPHGVFYNIRIITTSDQQLTTDEVIVYELNTDISFTLLDATGSGRFLIIKNKGTGTITIGSLSGEIDDNTTQDIDGGDSMQLVDYALNEHIIV